MPVQTHLTHPIFNDHISDIGQLFVGKDKPHVALDVRKESLKIRVLVQMTTNSLPNGRVLTYVYERVYVCMHVCVHVQQ